MTMDEEARLTEEPVPDLLAALAASIERARMTTKEARPRECGHAPHETHACAQVMCWCPATPSEDPR